MGVRPINICQHAKKWLNSIVWTCPPRTILFLKPNHPSFNEILPDPAIIRWNAHEY